MYRVLFVKLETARPLEITVFTYTFCIKGKKKKKIIMRKNAKKPFVFNEIRTQIYRRTSMS